MLVLTTTSANAANWINGGAGNDWSDTVNWDAAVPNAVDAQAVFGTPADKPDGAVYLDTDVTLGSMIIHEGYWGGFPPKGLYAKTNTETLTFQVSSGNATWDASALDRRTWPNAVVTNANVAIVSDVDVKSGGLNGNGLWTIPAIQFDYRSTGALSGSGAINITSGTLGFRGGRDDSGYTGDFNVSDGAILQFENANPLGAGSIHLDTDGTLFFAGSITERDIVLSGNGIAANTPKTNGSQTIRTVISGPGQLTINKDGTGSNDNAFSLLDLDPDAEPAVLTPNTHSGGTAITGVSSAGNGTTSALGQVVGGKDGAFGTGDVTVSGQNWLTIGAAGTTDTISDTATLTIAGDPSAFLSEAVPPLDGDFLLDMQANETVGAFIINITVDDVLTPVTMDAGTYGKSGSGAANTGANAQLGFDLDLLFSDSFDNGGLGVLTVGSAGPTLPGDANDNGFVDDDDLAILLSNWESDPGTITTWALGDFTADTDVDDDDLAVLLGNWTGPAPGGAAVPEPATLALLGLGGVATLRRRRKL